jgi:hypothetical protein
MPMLKIPQLVAEESVLQMANRPALVELERFNTQPSRFNASRLVGIPSLLGVLNHHKGSYPEELLEVCQWLHWRGNDLLSRLVIHQTDEPSIMVPEAWWKVNLPVFHPLHRTYAFRKKNTDWMLL